MRNIILIYFILCIITVRSSGTDNEEKNYEEEDEVVDNELTDPTEESPTNCWMTLNAGELFRVLDQIDDRYADVRKEMQESEAADEFDETMMEWFISNKGAALRELYAHHYHARMIPSGINLGGYSMLRMPNSVLFFHRMKLRNNTYFRVDGIKNDLSNMVMRTNLTLHDLHLRGSYERALTNRDPSVLIYSPSFGEVEFLLNNVRYKVEARYRLIKGKLTIELITSEIIVGDILMTYINQALENKPMRIQRENLDTFMDRLKVDLDKWLKDYFNDLLMYAELEGLPHMAELQKYDKEKGTALEEYTDYAINLIRNRLRSLNADAIQIPMFTFRATHGLQIKLYDGLLHGLDSMYRRSVATGIKQRDIRRVDTVVGFSNLKVVYKYEAMIPTGIPPLTGVMTLSSNELAAHLALAMVNDPMSADIDIEFLDLLKPESLTVEGAANIMIANFKSLLEHQIVAVMSNTLIHGIRMLRSLPRCEPFIVGQIKAKESNDPIKISSSSDKSDDTTDDTADTDGNQISDIKAALRSTEKPPTTSIRKGSSKTKVARKKLRKFNRKKQEM